MTLGVLCTNIAQEGSRFEVEEIEVGVSGFSKEKLLVTCTVETTVGVKDVEREEAGEGNEKRVITVEEIIGLIEINEEGTRGVEEEEV